MGERILVNKHKDNIFAYDTQADRCSWRGRKDGLPRRALRRAAVTDFTPLRPLTLPAAAHLRPSIHCILTLRLLKSNLTSIVCYNVLVVISYIRYVVCKVCPQDPKGSCNSLHPGWGEPEAAASSAQKTTPMFILLCNVTVASTHDKQRKNRAVLPFGATGRAGELRAAHSSTHLQHEEEERSPLRGTCQRLITLICQEHHQDSKGRSI